MNGSYFVFMDGSPYEVIQIKQKTGDVLIKYKAFMMKEVADATDRKNRSHPGATDITAVN
jgi:hypothetical protein